MRVRNASAYRLSPKAVRRREFVSAIRFCRLRVRVAQFLDVASDQDRAQFVQIDLVALVLQPKLGDGIQRVFLSAQGLVPYEAFLCPGRRKFGRLESAPVAVLLPAGNLLERRDRDRRQGPALKRID